jgi:uncharacterized damage-inducible protein DinB
MTETPAQYMVRILANVEGKDPLTVLEATPKTLTRLTSGRSDDLLRRRPAPERWSIAEVVAHLADVEMVVGYRIRLVLGAPGGPIQAFDQDTWAAAESYNDIPISMAVAAHTALRALNLRLFRSLSTEQWNSFGIHAERGQESVRKMITHLAGHDVNHLRQIEAIVSGARASAQPARN